ncbi:MAG TPA: 2-succinyl-6-hydroxy-2,4-cyclohexadiene-1-carboxylate synthase [Balneola sp.]|nr:2-succinyl-6-hydroxy-2,4-cyclohexadiene-1-carboxylate synthase [Bacteroidota bacterium]HCI71093.1 2-succinyl-6-hydroxy-2,4-cyclohexadiene-1-carboxylate synthase [Balneola sp.]HCT55543.1 2-succinyl-6-hydroxy-2,4-cyclohexadiene-1-carboxylate synthase [Balneola sp.]|tara:strand:- start:608 stop:1429 length:822 start_codon:yes stop_codon:yes gene_type:complete
MKIKVRGIQYFYQIHQHNKDLPYLVLLHGFMGSSQSFKELIPSLSTFCNPITIDLLGHGETDGSEMHYRFASREQTADIIKLISEQFQYPLFLYGYSMGGRLALQIALQRPDLIQGLILESTTFGIENEQERQARQVLDAQRADSISGNFDQFLKEWELLPIFESNSLHKEAKILIKEIQKNQTPLWISNSLLGFGTGNMPCVKNELDKLAMPVQLFAGENDQKFTNVMATMQNRISNATLKIFENANHRVHIEQIEEFVKSLKKFILTNTLS